MANQYFISGRYFEALDEYSKLPMERQDDLLIKKKMIICAALNNNFEKALVLLSKIRADSNSDHYGLQLLKDECLCDKLLEKLESQKNRNVRNDEQTGMQIAILSYFTDRAKSLKFFNELKNSGYSNIVNDFIETVKHKSHTPN